LACAGVNGSKNAGGNPGRVLCQQYAATPKNTGVEAGL
jgi:hypothetical protein